MTQARTHFAIRRFRPEFDCSAIGALYKLSVKELGQAYYEPDAIAAWATWGSSAQTIALTLSQGQTLIAQHSGRIAAFAQRHPQSHINMLYTHPDFSRKGIATALLEELFAAAKRDGLSELTVDASRASRALFAKAGFEGSESEWITRENVSIERFPMRMALT